MITNILTTALTALVVTTPSPSAPPMQLHNWEKLQPNQTQTKTYTVQSGDSLGSIAASIYGTSDDWITLWDDNSWIQDPNSLYSGWELTVRQTAPTADQNVLTDDLKKQYADLHKVNVTQTTPSITVQPSATPETTPSVAPSASPTQTPAATATPTPSQDTGSSPYDAVYQAAGAKFGVPWQILYGIHMTETGGRNGDIMNHSGSGAEGPMQFMPGTFRAYAEDGDGDGKTDIANAKDAIFTAANYLAKHGSLEQGLHSYGGNISGTLSYARDRGWTGSL